MRKPINLIFLPRRGEDVRRTGEVEPQQLQPLSDSPLARGESYNEDV